MSYILSYKIYILIDIEVHAFILMPQRVYLRPAAMCDYDSIGVVASGCSGRPAIVVYTVYRGEVRSLRRTDRGAF